MPTEKPRITITMTEEQLKQVQDFQFGNKMKNQTQAILYLVELGFTELEKQNSNTQNKKTSEPGKSDSEVKKKSQVDTITAFLESIGVEGDLSDDDFIFLQAIVTAIKAHFKKHDKPIE